MGQKSFAPTTSQSKRWCKKFWEHNTAPAALERMSVRRRLEDLEESEDDLDDEEDLEYPEDQARLPFRRESLSYRALSRLRLSDEAYILNHVSEKMTNGCSLMIDICEKEISSVAALALGELFLSKKQEGRWHVYITRCHPKDEEAFKAISSAFQTAFRQGRIGEFTIMGFKDRVRQDMLLSIFRSVEANKKDDFNQDLPLKLRVENCHFNEIMMKSFQTWAQRVAISSCFFEPDYKPYAQWLGNHTTASFVAKAFENVSEKPKSVKIEDWFNIVDVGLFQDWNLQSLSIIGMRDVGNILGLASLVSTLKNLELNPYPEPGVSTLLRDPDCCLESLKLSFPKAHWKDKNAPRVWNGIFDYLKAAPSCLKSLTVRFEKQWELPNGSEIDFLCSFLSTKNHTLEQFWFRNFIFDIDRGIMKQIHPYTMRNWAGRRILMDDKVLPGLMVEVLVRLQQLDVGSYYEILPEESWVLRLDATYHLIQKGLNNLFF